MTDSIDSIGAQLRRIGNELYDAGCPVLQGAKLVARALIMFSGLEARGLPRPRLLKSPDNKVIGGTWGDEVTVTLGERYVYVAGRYFTCFPVDAGTWTADDVAEAIRRELAA